jgi:hypothetical protein
MTDDRRESTFDELAKGLASGEVSRGKALRLMGAALVGGTLASVPGIAWAAPRPRPDGKKCKRDSQCASGNCAGGVCQAQGGCPSGTTECDRTLGEGPPGRQCIPDCPQGQVLNTKRCQCVVPTNGTNVGCICGDFSERVACFPSSTCPEIRDDFCRDVCRDAGLVNTYCVPDDIC